MAAELGDAAEVLGVSVQLEAEAAQLDAAERAELLEGLGLGEGALPRVVRRRLPPARPAHVPHHRRQGVAGVDVPGRRQGARVRRRHPLRPAAGLHPGRGHPLGRAARARARGTKAKDVGKLRVEGKDYEVADGDVLEIRFNV